MGNYHYNMSNIRLMRLRELHKKDELLAAALRYPILWDGHLARPCIISGQDARTTRNFGYFFNWKSLSPRRWTLFVWFRDL